MQVGDKVKLDMPAELPYPLSTFATDWLEWLRKLDGQTVELVAEETMASSMGEEVFGWYIEKKAPLGVSPWAPTSWLCELKVGGYCNACGGIGKHRRMCPAGVAGDTVI